MARIVLRQELLGMARIVVLLLKRAKLLCVARIVVVLLL